MRRAGADLHIHTNYSDGSLSPEEVVSYAAKIGLSCISVTDHDSVFGVDKAIDAGKRYNVEIIPGVEVSAEEGGKEMHILGYCVNYSDPQFLGFLKDIRQDRIKRLYKMADNLKREGLEINAEDVIEFTGDVSISRLNIAKYMQASGLVPDWREAFKRYIGDTKPCYVSSFRYGSREVITAIKRAGGIPVIAHPAVNKLDRILPRLAEEGMEGIEAFHTEHDADTARRYEDFAREHGLLVTGGSDCHGGIKGSMLMGRVTIPYSYVEILKDAAKRS